MKYFQVLALLIISLIIFTASVKSMRSNAWYFNAMNILQAHASDAYSDDDLESAFNAIALANQIEPEHPQYLHILAHIKMRMLASQHEADFNELSTDYKEIEELLLKSLSLRKTWPETWIALAQVVSYQEGASERVYKYIKKAKKVGPYNFNVAYGAIQIALSNWQNLPPKFKALYLSELNLASKHIYKFKTIYSMAEKINRLNKVCLSLKLGSHFIETRKTYTFKKRCR